MAQMIANAIRQAGTNFVESLALFLPRMGNVPFNPEVKQDLTAWARAFEMPLRPDDRIDTPFPNTALSGPIAYVPQAIGINFARIVGASALMRGCTVLHTNSIAICTESAHLL